MKATSGNAATAFSTWSCISCDLLSDVEGIRSACMARLPSPNVTGNVTDESDNCATGLLATFCDSVVVEPCEGSNLIYRMWSLQDSCGNDAEMGTQLNTLLETVKAMKQIAQKIGIVEDIAYQTN